MGGGALPARVRREEHRAAAAVDRLGDERAGRLGVEPRHLRDRDEAGVGGAEVGDRAVVRAGAADDEVGITPEELRRRERGEDQLAREPEEVERATALRRVERTERVPALLGEQLGLQAGGRGGVAAALLGACDGLLGERPGTAQLELADARTHVGVGVARQPVGQLHQMAVGVVDDPILDVGHGEPPRRCPVRCPASVPACGRDAGRAEIGAARERVRDTGRPQPMRRAFWAANSSSESTPRVAQAGEPLELVGRTPSAAGRVADVRAHRGVLGLRRGDLVLGHVTTPRDEVHEHPEVGEHDHEDHPERLGGPAQVVAAEDVREDAEQQHDPDEEEGEPDDRPEHLTDVPVGEHGSDLSSREPGSPGDRPDTVTPWLQLVAHRAEGTT